MSNYICSHCGAAAYYDGRCGDGPVLMCDCDKGPWVDDGRGGYHTNPRNAQAIPGDESRSRRRYDRDERWDRDDD